MGHTNCSGLLTDGSLSINGHELISLPFMNYVQLMGNSFVNWNELIVCNYIKPDGSCPNAL